MQNSVIIFYGLFAMMVIAFLVILSAKESIITQSKFVSWYQMLFAGHTSKAFQVKDFILGPHHKIVLAKGAVTFVAFRSK